MLRMTSISTAAAARAAAFSLRAVTASSSRALSSMVALDEEYAGYVVDFCQGSKGTNSVKPTDLLHLQHFHID